MHYTAQAGYRFDSSETLNQKTVSDLVHHLGSGKPNHNKQKEILSGRGAVSYLNLEQFGEVAVKKYVRGGIFGKLIKNYHFKKADSRALQEFHSLELAAKLGLRVPKPLVAITKGKLFSESWLVMERLNYETNLAELSVHDVEKTFKFLPEVIRIFEVLIEHMIYHPDLHPGNFLIGKNQELYLIDFDKSGLYQGLPAKLREDYLLRWRRAVIKYELPDFLTEHLAASLRSK